MANNCNSGAQADTQTRWSSSYTFPETNNNAAAPMQQNLRTRPPTTAMPILPPASDTPTTVQSPYYTAGFLKNFIGRNVRVEFLIGTTGPLVDRVGELVEVGASYIVLRPYMTDDLLMADLYSIKFVNIYD